MTRIRFFIDPTKSDEEIAAAMIEMVEEHLPGYLKDEGSSPKPDFDEAWRRIKDYADQTFIQKRGGHFRYRVDGDVLYPNRTNRALPRSQFQGPTTDCR